MAERHGDKDPFGTQHWPLELRVKSAEKRLEVDFDDGFTADLPAEFLRVHSPSAEVQGHAPDQRVLVTGKQAVGIQRLEPVGNYAVRIVFDDGHNTGLFAWAYLYELGRRRDELWDAHLKALAAQGLSR